MVLEARFIFQEGAVAMTEPEQADLLAHRILDDAHADPDDDLAVLARQLLRRDEAVARLLAAIRKHRDYRGDDRCFQDDAELYSILPEGDTRPERETAVTLENCERYIACRQGGQEYVSPQRRIEALEADLLATQTVVQSLAARVVAQSECLSRAAEKQQGTVADAVRAERRACIEIVRTLDVGWHGISPERLRREIAKAIEARGNGGEVTRH